MFDVPRHEIRALADRQRADLRVQSQRLRRIARHAGECFLGCQQRLQHYWQPYHQALAAELVRLRAQFGTVVLFDCHSIRSRVPRLFDGVLPDFNLGTSQGRSCAPELRAALIDALTTPDYTLAVDGRFTGGYITRHYGAPADGVHAFQLELSQATYMHEDDSNAFKAHCLSVEFARTAWRHTGSQAKSRMH